MKSSRVSSLLLLLSIACGAPSTVATRPTPTPPPAPRRPRRRLSHSRRSFRAVTLAEAPRNWQLLDESIDHVPGISSERAMNELLVGQDAQADGASSRSSTTASTRRTSTSRRTSGSTRRRRRATTMDDDHNGFVDDVHGWNFIGGKDGQDVHFDTFEVTREYARCHGRRGGERLTADHRCGALRGDRSPTFEKQRNKIQSPVDELRRVRSTSCSRSCRS